ncbi:unnamed protein product [Choristocarpus tenellus]
MRISPVLLTLCTSNLAEKPSEASIDAARAWIGVEDNDKVANAILEDMEDQQPQESLYQSDNESSGDKYDDGFMAGGSASGALRKGAAPSVFSIPPPSYCQVADEFASLETTTEDCGMNDVSYHLWKAKLA